MNYARRQQDRRLWHAIAAALGAGVAALLAVMIAMAGSMSAALVVLLFAVTLGFQARHQVRLAARSRVGAHSEEAVRRALAPLRSEGWRLRHSLSWRGPGDIDSVAIAPGNIVVVIETKTRTYQHAHLRRMREQADWLATCRPRCCRHGVVPMLCLAGAYGVQRVEDDVLVVSIDRLTPMVRWTANLVLSA